MRVAAKHRGDWGPDLAAWEGSVERRLLFGPGAIEVARLGRGEPILMVGGLAGGWKLLAPLARLLARRYEVILYGLRGDRGPLTVSAPESIADHARDLAFLIDRLGLERPALFGVSFGGAVALEYAVEHPGRLGSLTLLGVEARYRETLGARIARRVLERYPLPNDNPFVNQFFNLLHGGPPRSAVASEFLIERCWETDQGVMARRLQALASFDVSDRLDRIDARTLIVAGSKDVVVPADRQRDLARSIADARFSTVEGGGHVAFLTHRAEVARLAHRFLRSRSLARSGGGREGA